MLRINENNLIPNLSSEISDLFAQLNELAGSKDSNFRANIQATLDFPQSSPNPIVISQKPDISAGQIVSAELVFVEIPAPEPQSPRSGSDLDSSKHDPAGGVGFRVKDPAGKVASKKGSSSVVTQSPSSTNVMR